MFKKEFSDSVKDIKSAERRLNIIMPVMAVLFLVGFVIKLISLSRDDNKTEKAFQDQKCKDEIIELKTRVARAEFKSDSLMGQMFRDKTETNAKLEAIVKRQEQQKELVKKLKR